MNRRITLVCVILFSLCCSGTLRAQETVFGLLISDANAQPVPLAGILNKATKLRSLSNRKGYFHLNVKPTDTLVFSSVDFDPLVVVGAELLKKGSDTSILLMHQGVYKLNEFSVVYPNRKRDSIARVVAQILKTDTLLNNNDRILNRPRGRTGSDVGLGYTGFLTEVYYQFSKEGKDMVRFENFVRYYREVQAADKRYNKDVIKQATGLPDDQLDDFILSCNMDRAFILSAPDYDLVKKIKECETEFRRKQK